MSERDSSDGMVPFLFGLLGILGVLPCIGPLIAIIAGSGDKSALGRTGYILGWVSVAIYVAALVLLAGVGLFLLLVAAMNS